jgi:hypothetical protein
MGIGNVRDYILLILIFVGFNYLVIGFASISNEFSCINLEQKLNSNITVENDTDIVGVTRTGVGLIIGLISGECEGLPSWFKWLDISMFIGLLFLARSFIGAT